MSTQPQAPPLVLNFSHPFNTACHLQLDELVPGWQEWRPRSDRVDDPSHPLPTIEAWLDDLTQKFRNGSVGAPSTTRPTPCPPSTRRSWAG